MKRLFFYTGIFLFLSCSPASEFTPEVLIEKCIAAHGGMDKWHSISTIDYRKKIVLYKEDGAIEKDLDQVHHYSTSPSLTGTIEWSDSITRRIIYSNGKAVQTNGDQNEQSSQAALDLFHSAYYVLNMPWKLRDSSARITYLGLDTILNEKIVHTLKVEYPSAAKGDIWEYYLDKEKYLLVANEVHHGSTYSLITNDEYIEYKGLKFNSKRTSYMVNSWGEVLYIRAKYDYEFQE